MVEMQMHEHTLTFTIGNAELTREYERQQSFRHKRQFWQAQIESKVTEPRRSQLLALVNRIKGAKDKRDKVAHGLWGGGMQSGSWSAGDIEDTEAKILGGLPPIRSPSWRLDFQGLRKIGRDLAELNVEMMITLVHPATRAY